MFSANGSSNYYIGPVNATGAFYTDNSFSGAGGGGGNSFNSNKRVQFDASRQSSVYSSISEVRPVNYATYTFIAY